MGYTIRKNGKTIRVDDKPLQIPEIKVTAPRPSRTREAIKYVKTAYNAAKSGTGKVMAYTDKGLTKAAAVGSKVTTGARNIINPGQLKGGRVSIRRGYMHTGILNEAFNMRR